MRFIKKYGTSIFLALLLVHLVCIYMDLPAWRMISKLVLIPFLLLYLSASREGIVPSLVISGLVFSFAGDLMLTFSGEVFFLLGMFAFICTHVCNFIFFVKLQKADKSGGIISMVLMAGFMLALGCYVLFSLNGLLGSLQVPIIVYMLMISAMAIAAAGTSRNAFVKRVAAQCFIPGAVLFALSDGILAMNKFAWHHSSADIAVMATYGMAQYFLVKGFIGTTQLKVHS